MALVEQRASDTSPGWNNTTGVGTERTRVSRSLVPPAPRELARGTDLWVSLSIAAVLGISAAAVAFWPVEQRAKVATPSVVRTQATQEPLPSAPTRFTNPFDASEVFVFPPGTSEDDARASVAEILLERARKRRAQLGNVKHARDHRPASFPTSALMSKSTF